LDAKKNKFNSFNIYFEDESRFGLFTRNGRSLTIKGVKPICTFQQVFKATWVFGAFAPKDGDKFILELPHCSSDMFQIYLDEFSKHNPLVLKVLIVDNGAFHKAKKLVIPENIVLVFQPPYSPELNAAEKIWAAYKRAFTNKIFKTLDEVSEFIMNFTRNLSKEIIQKTTSFDYVKPCLDWTIK
jgi:transposase